MIKRDFISMEVTDQSISNIEQLVYLLFKDTKKKLEEENGVLTALNIDFAYKRKDIELVFEWIYEKD